MLRELNGIQVKSMGDNEKTVSFPIREWPTETFFVYSINQQLWWFFSPWIFKPVKLTVPYQIHAKKKRSIQLFIFTFHSVATITCVHGKDSCIQDGLHRHTGPIASSGQDKRNWMSHNLSTAWWVHLSYLICNIQGFASVGHIHIPVLSPSTASA